MPSSSPKDRLRLAVQKSGRLSTDSLELLASCGIRVKSPKERLLLHADNFPIDVLFVRDDDIPQLVMDAVCDLGIVGTNVLEEAALERRLNGAAPPLPPQSRALAKIAPRAPHAPHRMSARAGACRSTRLRWPHPRRR